MSGTVQSADDPLLGAVQDLVNEIAAQRRAITANEKAQLALAGRIDALDERRRKGDGEIGRAVQAAAHEALGYTAKQMDRWSDDLRRAHLELDNLRRDLAKEHVEWRPWLYGAAAAGALAMLLVVTFMVRMVPDGWSDRLYAAAIGEDRWQAGASMMYQAGPEAFGAIRAADALLQRAGPEIDKCLKAAEKAAKPQRCSFTVAPPAAAEKQASAR
jgi:hypothetical protein